MLRLVFVFVSVIAVSRWFYSETELLAPRLVPPLNFILNKISIPTHDKWSRQSVDRAIDFIAALTQSEKTDQNK